MLQIEKERELLSDQRNLMESFNSLCFVSDLETFEVNITNLCFANTAQTQNR